MVVAGWRSGFGGRRELTHGDLPVLSPAGAAFIRDHHAAGPRNDCRALVDARLRTSGERDVLVFLFIHVELVRLRPARRSEMALPKTEIEMGLQPGQDHLYGAAAGNQDLRHVGIRRDDVGRSFPGIARPKGRANNRPWRGAGFQSTQTPLGRGLRILRIGDPCTLSGVRGYAWRIRIQRTGRRDSADLAPTSLRFPLPEKHAIPFGAAAVPHHRDRATRRNGNRGPVRVGNWIADSLGCGPAGAVS